MKIGFRHHDNVFFDELLAGLEERFPDHELLDWPATAPAPALDLDLLLIMGKLSRADLEVQPKLFFVQLTSAGYEGIDIAAATDLGIWVSYAPSGETGNAISVAEWAVFLMIGASRRLRPMLDSISAPTQRATRVNTGLAGKTACIIGLGAIGRLLAERLSSFGMTLVATHPRPAEAPAYMKTFLPTELHTAVADADYTIVCAPASPDNRHLIDADVLAAMKRDSILINVSRGALVDEAALCDALASGHIGAVGLDVVEHEPLAASDPLLAFPQALISPHIAGGTDLMIAGSIDYIERVMAGIAAGEKPKSTLNEPAHPRKPLR